MYLCSRNKFKSEEWDVKNIQYSPVVRCVYTRHRTEILVIQVSQVQLTLYLQGVKKELKSS